MSATIKAGDLRHPVTLVKPVTEVGDHGRRTTSWVDVATVMSGKADVSGREFYAAHAVQAEDIETFTVRYRDDIDTTWRVREGSAETGTLYNILEVNHLGYMRDYIRLKCRNIHGGGV